MTNKYVDLLESEIENNIWTGYVTYYPHKKAYKNLGMQMQRRRAGNGLR